MTNKARLEAVLRGEAPDIPPHFEMVFQLEREAFGIELIEWEKLEGASQVEKERQAALNLEINTRLVEEYGWAAVSPEMGGLAQLKKAVGDKALVYAFNGGGTFFMMPGDEMMEFVIRLFEKPEGLHEEARGKVGGTIELAKRQRDAGADFIIMNSDYGFNTGPFISPKHFAEFITPYLTEVVAGMHELGLPVILHSDGNLNSIMDQLVGAGLDGYQSVDPQGGMDIKAVREAYPDLILMGNVECAILQDVNDDRIRAGVRYCMEHGGVGKPYIFSSSNCIFEGVPLENYHVMLDEYRSLCLKAG